MNAKDLSQIVQTADLADAIGYINQAVQENGPGVFNNLKDTLGRSFPHWCAKHNRADLLAEVCSKYTVNLNALDRDGTTPLIVSAMQKDGTSNQAAIWLLNHPQVDPSIENKGRFSALSFARNMNNEPLALAIINRAPSTINHRPAVAEALDIEQETTLSHMVSLIDRMGSPFDAPVTPSRSAPTSQRTGSSIIDTLSAAGGIARDLGKGAYSAARRLADDLNKPQTPAIPGGISDSPTTPNNSPVRQAIVEPGANSTPQSMQQAKPNEEKPARPVPDHIKGYTPEQIDAYQKLMDLGIEDFYLQSQSDPHVGRSEEKEKIASMILKEQNVLMVGSSGSGKKSTAILVAEELHKSDIVMLSIPSTLLRGNKYAGSVNENLQKWLPLLGTLRGKAAVFINETHVLSTGKTSSDSTDTPAQILREYLDGSGPRRIVMLGSTTQKHADKLAEEEESLYRLLVPFQLQALTPEQTKDILIHPSTAHRLERQGFTVGDPKSFEFLVDETIPLLQNFIYNQAFPKKAFEFIKHALRDHSSVGLTQANVEELFSEFYRIPIELVRGELNENSPYLNLAANLKSGLRGQDASLDNMSATVVGSVVLSAPGKKKPISFLSAGPTGVGKTESFVLMQKILNLPELKFSMGEYKSFSKLDDLIDQLSDFCTKNYAGIVLVDELEKAHPQILDVLLNFLDKGAIGSGVDQVYSGAITVVATTNLCQAEIVTAKKKMFELFGHRELDQDWCRELLIDAGLRPEFVNRFSKVLDYSYITMEDALIIGKSAFAKKSKVLAETKDIHISFEPSYTETQIRNNFDDANGARGVIRLVESAYDTLTRKPEILLGMRKGTHITVTEKDNTLHVHMTFKDGTTREIDISDTKNNDIKRQQLAVLQSFGRATDSIAKLVAAAAPTLTAPVVPAPLTPPGTPLPTGTTTDTPTLKTSRKPSGQAGAKTDAPGPATSKPRR